MPRQLNHRGTTSDIKVMRLGIRSVITVILLACLATPAFARRGVRKYASEELRLRLGGYYGNYMYSSALSGLPENTALTLLQPGGRMELEGWLPKSRFGLMFISDLFALDYKNRPDNFQGQPLYFANNSLNVGWRISGHGGAHNSQSAIFVGPAALLYPDVTTFSNLKYDRVWARHSGLRMGFRNRVALASGFIFEFGGYLIQPYKLMGDSGTLTRSETRSVGANVNFDIKMSEGISLGIGYHWGINRMVYQPNGAWKPHVLIFNTNAGLASILFWL